MIANYVRIGTTINNIRRNIVWEINEILAGRAHDASYVLTGLKIIKKNKTKL